MLYYNNHTLMKYIIFSYTTWLYIKIYITNVDVLTIKIFET